MTAVPLFTLFARFQYTARDALLSNNVKGGTLQQSEKRS
jgi:hypothetical protein